MSTSSKFIKLLKQKDFIMLLSLLLFSFSSIVSIFNQTLRHIIFIPYKIDTFIIYFIYLSLWLLVLNKLLYKFVNNYLTQLIFLFVFIGYLIIIIEYPQYFDLILKFGFNFLIAFAWLLVGLSIKNFYNLYRYLYIPAYLCLISIILNIFVFNVNFFNSAQYSQEYGYILLIPSVIFFDKLKSKINFIYLLLFFLSIGLMIFIGARGPVASLGLFILISYLFNKNKSYKYFRLLFLILIVFIFYLFYDQIIDSIYFIAQDLKLSTRLLNLLNNNNFFVDNDRIKLISISTSLLIKYPFLGVGIFKDRILLSDALGIIDPNQISGWYPHNIFIEILLNFGLFFGSLVIIILITSIIRVIHIFRHSNKISNIYFLFLALSFFPLLFSSSYLESNLFFFFIGCTINLLHYRVFHLMR